LLFHWLIGLIIMTGVVSASSFVLYVRARMKEDETKERSFRSIHYLSLFIFVVIGVILLIMVSNMDL
jgi:hypothetical protein